MLVEWVGDILAQEPRSPVRREKQYLNLRPEPVLGRLTRERRHCRSFRPSESRSAADWPVIKQINERPVLGSVRRPLSVRLWVSMASSARL